MQTFDELIRQFTEIIPPSYTFGITDIIVVLLLSFVLSMVIAKVYSYTHNNVSYSQTFVHTLIILSMVVSAIMLIVGSNIARAFTLLGALSIVRFRNAVKDTRDVGYVFLVMGIGMACGTRFYAMAVVMTTIISLVQIFLVWIDFGSKNKRQSLLRLLIGSEDDSRTKVENILSSHLKSYSLIDIEGSDDSLVELNYVIVNNRNTDEIKLLNEIRKVTSNKSVSIIHGDKTIEV